MPCLLNYGQSLLFIPILYFIFRDLAFMSPFMVLLLILPDRFNSQNFSLLIEKKEESFDVFIVGNDNDHIVTQDKANPLATVLSTAMLLRYGLGEEHTAKRIEDAVLETLNKGFRTGDIHSTGKVYSFSCVFKQVNRFSLVGYIIFGKTDGVI